MQQQTYICKVIRNILKYYALSDGTDVYLIPDAVRGRYCTIRYS